MDIAQTAAAEGMNRSYADALPLLAQDFHRIPDRVG
jgi:hypothetical protein